MPRPCPQCFAILRMLEIAKNGVGYRMADHGSFKIYARSSSYAAVTILFPQLFAHYVGALFGHGA